VLEIKNLHVSVEGKEILRGINLKIDMGQIHAIMGPNGGGKSSLAMALMGHPNYKIESGDILFEGKSILQMKTYERAKLGLFLAFQYPYAVPGVSVFNFLRTAYTSLKFNGGPKTNKEEFVNILEFSKFLSQQMKMLEMDDAFARRYLNDGFSGGEKKKAEILQMAILKPKIAVVDEADSGADIDSLKIIANCMNRIFEEHRTGFLLITHYNRILQYIKPDYVHVLVGGKIVKTGDRTLADEVEAEGYGNFGASSESESGETDGK